MRLSAKAFVVDPGHRVLLLDCVDPADPATTWWELPGGGVETGEDEVDALVREVREETGLVLDAAAVGPVLWTQELTFTWLGSRHRTRCHGRVVHVRDPATTATQLTGAEQGTILGQRWWTSQEMSAHPGRFFPSSMPTLVPQVLAGERVDEPFERWN